MIKKYTTYWILSVFILLSFGKVFADQGTGSSFAYMWTDWNTATPPTIDYEWIDASDGTAVISGAFTDSVFNAIALPFNFNFFNLNRDSIYVSTNGWATLSDPGTNSHPTNLRINSSSTPDSLLSVYWDDMYSINGTNSGIFYKTVGSSPNRK